MSTQFVSPGAYWTETDHSDYLPALGLTSVGLVGTASWGPLNQVTLVTNPGDLTRFFGYSPKGDDMFGLYAALRYLRQGKRLYYVRVGASGDVAKADYALRRTDGTTVLTYLQAIYPGSRGNDIAVKISMSNPVYDQTTGLSTQPYPRYTLADPHYDIDIAIIPDGSGDRTKLTVVEQFKGVNFKDATGASGVADERFIENILEIGTEDQAPSVYLRASLTARTPAGEYRDGAAVPYAIYETLLSGAILSDDGLTVDSTNTDRWIWLGDATSDNPITGAGDAIATVGNNGSVSPGPATVDVTGGENWGVNAQGLNLFANTQLTDINILAAPGFDDSGVHERITTICQDYRRDCIGILDPPRATISPSDNITKVADFTNGMNDYSGRMTMNSSYTAFYWPWVEVPDSYHGGSIWLPPSCFAIEAMAFTDRNYEPWFAPAGFKRGVITGALRVEKTVDQGQRDYLQSGGNIVNTIVPFPRQGIVIWGQRTTQRRPTALDRINVRRLMCHIEKAVSTATQYLVFDPHDEFTRREFLRLVEPLIEFVKARRGVYDFRVICDDSTNPAELIDRNEMHGKVLIKPTKTAEVIVTDFILLPTGASFSEY